MISKPSTMFSRIPQLTTSRLSLSRGYVCFVARRVPAPLQSSATCLNSYHEKDDHLFSLSLQRSYATRAVSRPKAHTGRAKAATPRKAAASAKKPVKKPVSKKPKTKKRVVKAQPKSKTKPKKKVLSEADKAKAAAQKKKQLMKDLAAKALDIPKPLPSSAWTVMFSERQSYKGNSNVGGRSKEIAVEYRNLSPERREHYNHVAVQNKHANEAVYKKFIESHSEEEIRVANSARGRLRKLKASTKGLRGMPSNLFILHDHRHVKKPLSSYIKFSQERFASGDLAGMSTAERGKLVGREWQALSDSEKKAYASPAAATAA